MANAKVLYTGDGTTTNYTVPFPYIEKSHVFVYVNEVLMIAPLEYVWLDASNIQFKYAPAANDAIEIKRWTEKDTPLVNFQNAAVLTAADLNLSQQQNFYIMQEAIEGFNDLINDALFRIASGVGIVETDPDEVIAALVNEMLNDASAATLQQRVADIDINAEAIISLGDGLQAQINTLAQGTAAIVYIQPGEPVPGVGGIPDPIPDGARWYDSDDNNHPYVYDQTAVQWISIDDPRIGQAVSDISVLQTNVSDNAAAIVDEAFARSTQDSAFAQTFSLIGAENLAGTAFIIDLNTVQITDGVESLADRFNSLQVDIDGNAADIVTEQTARAAGDSANASSITALDTRLTTAEGNISSQATAISLLQTDVSTAEGNISSNASAITALQSEVDLRATTFFQSAPPTANNVGDLWIDADNDKLYRWNGTVWVNIQDSAIAGNASAITGLDTRVTTAEGTISSHASSITTLNASVSTLNGEMDTAQVDIVANASAVSTAQGDITTLEAKFGVTLDVNDYITGFAQNNDGKTGTFVIVADKFGIVEPGTLTQKIWWDGVNSVLQIDGDVIVDGTINGANALGTSISARLGSTHIGDNSISTDHLKANAVTAGKILAGEVDATHISGDQLDVLATKTGTLTVDESLTMSAAGHIKGGQTAYNTGNGYWLGYSGAAYKFSIGNPSVGNYMTWDGSTLVVKGDLFVGEYALDDNIMLSADATETHSGTDTKFKQFTIDRAGEVRITYEYKGDNDYTDGQVRVKVNGSTKNTKTVGNVVSWTSSGNIDLSGGNAVSEGDTIEVWLDGGQTFTDRAEPSATYLRNVKLRGIVSIPAEGGTVDLN